MPEMTAPPTEPDDPHNARLVTAGEQENVAWLDELGGEYRLYLEAQAVFMARQVAYYRTRTAALGAEVIRRDESILELETELAELRPPEPEDERPEDQGPWS